MASGSRQHRRSARKVALLEAYQTGLRTLPSVRTNAVSISSKNETARYSLVFATHSDYGLECFNPVKWRLDPMQGVMVSERRGMEQGDLFAATPIVDELRRYLIGLEGTAVQFTNLATEAGNRGYMVKHLRQTLDELAAEGIAVREHPLKATTKWPTDSLIRFYSQPWT